LIGIGFLGALFLLPIGQTAVAQVANSGAFAQSDIKPSDIKLAQTQVPIPRQAATQEQMSEKAIAVPQEAPPPPPFPTLTRRVARPPAADAPRKITVQKNVPSIDSASTPSGLAKPDTSTTPDRSTLATPRNADQTKEPDLRVANHRGFWEHVSPSRADSRPGRLHEAMATLALMDDVPRPRLQTMQDIAVAHGVAILASTVGTRVSPALVLALIAVESAGRQNAVSRVGAEGLMQLMPATADRFGVRDSFDPMQNIGGGVAYLDWLMDKFDGDPILVLASYNAGEGAVSKHDGVPPYSETRDYVPKVLAAFEVARALCTRTPEMVSDGCVFVTMN
jgi:hypothetical protein